MNLTAALHGECVALSVPANARVDAAIVGQSSAIEVELTGNVRVNERNPQDRTAVLSLSFELPETARGFIVTAASKLGMPAFTSSEWAIIAKALRVAAATSKLANAVADEPVDREMADTLRGIASRIELGGA